MVRVLKDGPLRFGSVKAMFLVPETEYLVSNCKRQHGSLRKL